MSAPPNPAVARALLDEALARAADQPADPPALALHDAAWALREALREAEEVPPSHRRPPGKDRGRPEGPGRDGPGRPGGPEGVPAELLHAAARAAAHPLAPPELARAVQAAISALDPERGRAPDPPRDPLALVVAELDADLPTDPTADDLVALVRREEEIAALLADRAAWVEARLRWLDRAATALGALGALLGLAAILLVLEMAGVRPVTELLRALAPPAEEAP